MMTACVEPVRQPMVTVLQGDVRAVLAGLPSASFDCVVTSPPYWGLRDYGTARWVGGDPACDHRSPTMRADRNEDRPMLGGSVASNRDQLLLAHRTGCGICGATRVDDQIGLEPTLGAHLAVMVDVFRAVRRVLKSHGTVWLNYGDCYAAAPNGRSAAAYKADGTDDRAFRDKPFSTVGPILEEAHSAGRGQRGGFLKPKDLCMIPNRLAIALQDDGWWVRSEIIWHKPNPMPESIYDRPTSAHEKVWLLTKSEDYFYNHEAIREPVSAGPQRPARVKRPGPGSREHVDRVPDARKGARIGPSLASETRNARNVWTIAPKAYRDAHFACVDQETECLTATGWRRHADLKPGMLAAQFDIETDMLSWAPVQAVARYDVNDQDMVVGRCRDLEMWLTPNHRALIRRRHPRTRVLQQPIIIRADEMKASHSVPTAAEWLFEGDASVAIEWAELLGWYVADGHQSKDSLSVELYQSEAANSAKCRRIEDLLRQVGAEWTKASCTRIWRGRDASMTAYRILGYAAVRLRELAPAKLLPWSTVLWAKDRVAALVDGLVGGDGHARLDGRRAIIQKNDQQCDLFQTLAMRLGYSATRSIRQDGVGVVYVTSHKTRSFRGTNGRGSAPEFRKYSGIVWCPKLPNGTWVARRNGKPFITGNTFPPALAERCMRAGVPALACSFCGNALPQDACAGACRIVPPVPGRVLDPFGGSGTVGLVAQQLGVDATLIELSPDYVAMTRRRLGLEPMAEAAE